MSNLPALHSLFISLPNILRRERDLIWGWELRTSTAPWDTALVQLHIGSTAGFTAFGPNRISKLHSLPLWS